MIRRTVKDPPEEPRKARSGKDRKKWCGGKVGVHHKGKWVSSDVAWGHANTPQDRQRIADRKKDGSWKDWSWEILVCEVCGKQMQWRKPK